MSAARPVPQLYAVNDIYASVQGEGALTGTPMVVLRLQGCLVHCHFCDTKETWGNGGAADARAIPTVPSTPLLDPSQPWRGATPYFTRMNAASIAAMCRAEAPAVGWVMLTGGEPAEQDLAQLVAALHLAGFKVSLETSGTADGMLEASIDHMAVSPKPNNPGKRPLLRHVIQMANEVKWLVGKQDDVAAAIAFAADYGMPHSRIALQPISQNAKATQAAMAAAVTFGFRVSIQIHKYIEAR